MKKLVLVGLVALAPACGGEKKNGAEEYLAKSKRIEAKMNLNRILKGSKVAAADTGTLVKGKAAMLPAENCCKGTGGKCAVVPDATWSADPVWGALHFEVEEPARFQYAYESDGTTATATATGDLDCDGKQIVYKLEMKVGADGVVTSNMTEPTLDAD